MRVIGLSILLATAHLAPASSFVFTPFSGPEGVTSSLTLTGINNAGQIVGYSGNFSDSQGFLRHPNGSYTSISVLGSQYTGVWGAAEQRTGLRLENGLPRTENQ